MHARSSEVVASARPEGARDALTGLADRALFRRRLAAAASTGRGLTLLFLDLDNFKNVNDGYGHAVGDELLCEVGRRLEGVVRADDTVGRLGGDEFVVLCEDIRDALEARLIGQQLRRLLNRPIEIGEKSLMVGASIGVAVFPDDADNADDLLKNADLALYHAKAEGRGRCRHFTEQLGSQREMEHIERICREGTGADRQIAVFQRTHDMKAVVDQVVAETYEGLAVAAN